MILRLNKSDDGLVISIFEQKQEHGKIEERDVISDVRIVLNCLHSQSGLARNDDDHRS